MRLTNRMNCFGEESDSLCRDSSFLRDVDPGITLGKPEDGELLQPDLNGSVCELKRPSSKPGKWQKKKKKQIVGMLQVDQIFTAMLCEWVTVKALPRARGRAKPLPPRLLCFVKFAKHLMNEAVNCRADAEGIRHCRLLVFCRSNQFAMVCVAEMLRLHLPGGVGAGPWT